MLQFFSGEVFIMDLINDRYRIIKNIKQNSFVSTYIAADLISKLDKVQLNIINPEYLPEELLNYYTSEFITLTSIKCSNIVRLYSFGIVNFIDNKKISNYQYYYINEFVDESTTFDNVIDNLRFDDVLTIFIDICKAVNYLHIKGFFYGELNPENIIISTNSKNSKVKLKDLATIVLNKYDYKVTQSEQIYYKAPELLKGDKPNVASDIYSLGAILMLLSRNNYNSKLIDIISKMTAKNPNDRYNNIYEIIEDINNVFSTQYKPFIRKEVEQLNYNTKIIGREYEIRKIMHEFKDMTKHEHDKKLIFVHGESGIGKTRLFKEIRHIFTMKNANVFSNLSTENKNINENINLLKILKKIISECDMELVDRYQSILSSLFPEVNSDAVNNSLELMDEKSKFKLVNGIAGFIGDFLKNKQSVFILDDIDLSSDFSIDFLEYMYIKKLDTKGIMCIMSYSDGYNYNKKLSEFLKNVSCTSDVTDIALHGLSDIETGNMLQHIMSMPSAPVQFAGRIYSKTYGNPQFIQETMKMLFSNKILYINQRKGAWDSKYDYNYEDLPMPSNIEQAVLSQIKKLDKESATVLDIMSVFNTAISIDILCNFLTQDRQHIEKIIENMIQRGIVCKKIEDMGFVFDFSNTILKNIIYDRLSYEEKIDKHNIAVKILESMDDEVSGNKEELIYHLEKSGEKDKVIKYCIENAKSMELLRNRNEAIKNLEKAVSMYGANAYDIEKMKLLIKIGDIYIESGNISTAIEYYNDAEKIAEIMQLYYSEVDILNKITSAYLNKNDMQNVKRYASKTEVQLDKVDYLKGYLLWKKNLISILILNNKFDEAYEVCKKCIDTCTDEYMELKGDFYNKLGNIYAYISKADDALHSYEKSISCYDEAGFEKGAVMALNNIGTVYSDSYQDLYMALKYFNRMKEISERNNFTLEEVLALTNLASTYNYCMEYDTALRYFKEALEKSKEIEFEGNIFYCYSNIALLYLKFYNYKKAYENLFLAQKEYEKHPFQGKDELGVFYQAGGEVYFELGDIEKADYFIKKALELYSNDDVKVRWECQVLEKLIDIRIRRCDINIYDEIEAIVEKFTFIDNKLNTIYTLCNSLYENGYYSEAKKLFDKGSKFEYQSNRTKAKKMYVSAILNNEMEKLEVLCKGLEIAKENKDKKLSYKMCCAIGDYYLFKKGYFYAVNYYFEACDIIKGFTLQVPEEYRSNFVKINKVLLPFNRLADINNGLELNSILKNRNEDSIDISMDEINSLFDYRKYDNILSNKKYINSAKKLYSTRLPKGINNTVDIIKNIPSDPIEGLKIILMYLSEISLATRSAVIIDNNNKDFSVIACTSDNVDIEHSKYILERVKSIRKPILITEYMTEENNSETNFIPAGVKSVMCIPILMEDIQFSNVLADRRKSTNLNSQFNGCIYLESDRVLNNFNRKSLEKCCTLSKLTGSIIEKYQLVLSSSIDKLTGVYTRKYLEDFITDAIEIANTRQEDVSLVMFDFDLFKGINDKYGHQTGDEVLKKVCHIVKSSIRNEDICGRYGGEEFIIVLPGANKSQALQIAEKLRKKIEAEKILGNKAVVTISLGIATYPEHGHWKQELIEKVDRALYVSKQTGRNKCQVWSNEFSSKAKTADKLTGIVTGNSVQDYRNVLAMVDIAELIKSNINIENKIYSLLGRIIETTEAQKGVLFTIKDGSIVNKFAREIFHEKWTDIKKYNERIINSVVEKQQGVFLIDWDNVIGHDAMTGMPDWQSIIVVPLLFCGRVKGVLYLSVSTKIKEFTFADFNFVNMLGQLAAAII